MSIDSAIQNVGEYFSAHYLADKNGFAKDIGDQVKHWKTQGSQSTPRKLQGLGEAFFAAKSKALDYPEPELRSKAKEKDLQSWHSHLLTSLGYHSEPINIELATEKKQLPALLRLHRHSQPWLAIMEAPFCICSGDLIEDALEEYVQPSSQIVEGLPTFITEWEQAIAVLFKQEDRPRWAMLLAGSRIYLFDAHTFAQGRYLYIDLDNAFSSKDTKTFEAIAALLSNDSLAPKTESEEVLHEKLREGSLKSTHGVSEQLQGAVREAIELIANGWIEARRQKGLGYKNLAEREEPLADGSRAITAEQLKHDALVYVYRILFCLYAEARGGELGVLPITDDIYRLGYSMEALRDLADIGEPGTQTEDGSYYAEHLSRLFTLVHNGFHPEKDGKYKPINDDVVESKENIWDLGLPEQIDLFGEVDEQPTLSDNNKPQLDLGSVKTFIIQPLTATLFAPKATPLLNRIHLNNRILHQVIRRLSLGTSSKRKQIGRINYAELGIVQLGSVYEGLLSYKGFFAKEMLIQVVKAGKPKKVQGKNEVPTVYDDAVDPKEPSWFVPESRLDEFKEGEIVISRNTRQARRYTPGTFILHLNGVDRVNSASYYTPEVLTRSLVKEALKERLKDFGPLQADEILTLKICEPAMGSAAFLVEAIDQLGRHYLTLKQEQLGQSIDPSAFESELGRVKHYISVQNVYGVDLNPIAVELGALSLWLASIHSLKIKSGQNGGQDTYRPGQTPWFGLRLRAGNSLIGARRAVWTYDQLASGKHYGKQALAPRQLKPGEQRGENEIYHFLVWDEDMAPAARDKLMKSYWKGECETINEWNKKEVKRRWLPEDLFKGKQLCTRVDELWEEYAKERVKGLDKTQCTASVWPTPSDSIDALRPGPTLLGQEHVKENLEAQSGAFQRLKLLMDAWCSFYFWPLDRSDELPTVSSWLASAEVLLGCNTVQNDEKRAEIDEILGNDIDLEGLITESQQVLPDAENLSGIVPWFSVAKQTNESQNFHHWELIFTEILGPKFELQESEPNGFDLMFGNPPWVGADWKEAAILAEYDPTLGVNESNSAAISLERPKLLSNEEFKSNYTKSFIASDGAAMFLNDITLYPAVRGMRTNLYKNFIERTWSLIGRLGIVSLIHPDTIFDDPRGNIFREKYYPKLKGHYHFRNEYKLFADVENLMTFSINVYGATKTKVKFKSISNLFIPKTISECSDVRNINSDIPAIKNTKGKWDVRGHSFRLLNIGENELKIFASLFEHTDVPFRQTRLPQIHSRPMMNLLTKFSHSSLKLGDLEKDWWTTTLMDEAKSQKDGLITRIDNPSYQPTKVDEWIVSGPHFFVGNPFYKEPFSACTTNRSYSQVNLVDINDTFIPRSVYCPGNYDGNIDDFYKVIPEWPKPQSPHVDNGVIKPGFCHISNLDLGAWEALLGEPLEIYGVNNKLPGARTARKFGYFLKWEGDVNGAITWLTNNNYDINSDAYLKKYSLVAVTQVKFKGNLNSIPSPIKSRFFYGCRLMCVPSNERTLIGSILPAGVSGINGVRAIYFTSVDNLLGFSAVAFSIVGDFFIKIKGKSNVQTDDVSQLPLPKGIAINLAKLKVLRLVCLTQDFLSLWVESQSYQSIIEAANYEQGFELGDSQKESVLLVDLERRYALIEIDVLVSISLGFSVEELIQIYSIQFAVFKGYEQVDQYDVKGSRLPNTSRKDPGAKELREQLKNHDGISSVTVGWEIDHGNQTVTKTFYPPFKHVDRIEDYKTAYKVFSERLGLNSDKNTKDIENAT
jgi:hypothetical protein